MANSSNKQTEGPSAAGASDHNMATVVIDGQSKEIDLRLLSQKVYALLQQELRIERERLGRG